MTADQLLTTGDLSAEIQVPEKTIVQWRHKRSGPPYVRLGKHVRYRRSDVDAWLASRYDSASSDTPPRAAVG